MRNAHSALYACHEGYTIGHLPTSGNSKTVAPVKMSGLQPSQVLVKLASCRASWAGLPPAPEARR